MSFVLGLACFTAGHFSSAKAQYRAGAFVDGQPVFGRRPSTTPKVRPLRRVKRVALSRPPRRVVRRMEARQRRPIVREAASIERQRPPNAPKAPVSRTAVMLASGAASAAGAGVAVVEPAQSRGARSPATVAPAVVAQAIAAVTMPLPRRSPAVSRKTQVERAPKTRDPAAENTHGTTPLGLAAVPPRPVRRPTEPKPIMQLVVSLKQQRLTVYQNDTAVLRTRVSTGKVGHRTPKGIFSIIQKRRFHRSNIYSGAPMPFMQRLTWSGIALHLGHVPGFPASHGCIRLPDAFAAQLFQTTEMRTHVVIADGNPVPVEFAHRNLPGVSDIGSQTLAVLADAPATERGSFGTRLASFLMPFNLLGTGTAQAADQNAPAQRDELELRELVAILHYDKTGLIAHRHGVVAHRDGAPLRILVTRRTTQDQFQDVQRQLLQLGYPVGAVDGRLGRDMVAALREFQKDQALKVTGLPDDATRRLLDAKAGPRASTRGTAYVRQGGEEIYSGPVMIEREEEPLGTHLYSLIGLDEATGRGNWTAMTLQAKGRLPGWSHAEWLRRQADVADTGAAAAIGRVTFPAHVRAAIEDRLTPGSSLIIADRGSERETGLTTDFVVLTD